ncbi:prepilin peptidase [bacterium]|nr:prepilin peptidase [bacterium]
MYCEAYISSETLIVIHSAVLLIVVLINGVTDLLLNRLFNVVNYSAIILGLLLNCVWGIDALVLAALGLFIGFVLFFCVYLFAGIGGGDVKFMAAIGAIGIPRFHESVAGYPFILWACFYSLLAGGLIAIVAIISNGRLMKSLRNITRTVLSFMLPTFVTVPLKPEDSLVVPFGFGIALGTAWAWWLYAAGFLE